jgi:ATP-dependent 26S proteasome regulatory subunit
LQINVSWNDIAGLDHVIQEIKESVVFPVKHRNMFNSSALYQAPKGVLFVRQKLIMFISFISNIKKIFFLR